MNLKAFIQGAQNSVGSFTNVYIRLLGFVNVVALIPKLDKKMVAEWPYKVVNLE